MVVLLAACGCTDVGCLSMVQVSLPSLVEWSGTGSFIVELCVGDYCQSQGIDPERAAQLEANNHGQISFAEIPNEVGKDRVSINVSADGAILQVESSAIDFESHRPNGAFCEPVCYYASVAVEDGQLVNR